MPRVHYVAKAAKDNQVCKKGESYYYWSFYRSPKTLSKTHPRGSQLDNTSFSQALAAQESVEDYLGEAENTDEDLSLLKAKLEEAADEIQQCGEEYREKAENMEEGFGHETEQSTAFAELADELETFADTVRDCCSADEFDADTVKEEITQELLDEHEAGKDESKDEKEWKPSEDDIEEKLEEKRDEWFEEAKSEVESSIEDMPCKP